MLDQVFDRTTKRMDQAIEAVKKELTALRTGRASTNIIENVMVDYYGSPTPIAQCCKLSVPDPGLIVAQPFDPTLIKEVEKAIKAADLGLNPSNDGKVIRLSIPPLTEERRHQIVKHAKKLAEDTRVACRNIRHDVINDLKRKAKDKDSHVSEDATKKLQDEVQKLTDGHIKKIDELLAHKEKEIMTV